MFLIFRSLGLQSVWFARTRRLNCAQSRLGRDFGQKHRNPWRRDSRRRVHHQSHRTHGRWRKLVSKPAANAVRQIDYESVPSEPEFVLETPGHSGSRPLRFWRVASSVPDYKRPEAGRPSRRLRQRRQRLESRPATRTNARVTGGRSWRSGTQRPSKSSCRRESATQSSGCAFAEARATMDVTRSGPIPECWRGFFAIRQQTSPNAPLTTTGQPVG